MTPENAHKTMMKDVRIELERATELHPKWPTDIVHAAAIAV
jgi:hypothetical protein